LSDEPDAIASFGAMDHEDGPVLVAGFDGRPGLDQVVDAARDIGRAADAGELDDGYGSHWWEHRNDVGARYRRLLGEERQFGPGVVVDTLEVGAPWRVVPLLYRGVRDALAEHAARPVACHLSHPDGSGASLSFTFLLHGEDDRVVERAYVTTWREAAEACHRAGGTISHHHGVGVSKAPFMEAELGPEGVSVLRSIKDALDPGGTLNPGKLLPQGGAG
jgi:alkyldihydroxyacetonephosphate synthase